MAYERLTGSIGLDRLDYHAALISERISNMLKGPNGRAFEIEDFLLRWKAQTTEG